MLMNRVLVSTDAKTIKIDLEKDSLFICTVMTAIILTSGILI